jgi:hypothetical protein
MTLCRNFFVVLVCLFEGLAFAADDVPLSDPYESEAPDDSEDELDLSDEDLQESQGERREASKWGALMSLGEGSAWNTFGARGVLFKQNRAISGAVGTGRFNQTGKSGLQRQYSQTQNALVRTQWWLSEGFPLAVMGEVGVHRWTIKSSCVANDNSSTCSSGTLKAIGGSFATGIMVSWLAQDDVFLEWTILGVKKSHSWKTDSDLVSGSLAEKESNDLIEIPKILNIVNFSLGLRF